MTKQKIINDIIDYLVSCKVQYYSECYVGITDNPSKRLFTDHKVDENKDVWICCSADTIDIARAVEMELQSKGMKGAPGGGSDDSIYVYAYKITPSTSESDVIDKEEGKQ